MIYTYMKNVFCTKLWKCIQKIYTCTPYKYKSKSVNIYNIKAWSVKTLTCECKWFTITRTIFVCTSTILSSLYMCLHTKGPYWSLNSFNLESLHFFPKNPRWDLMSFWNRKKKLSYKESCKNPWHTSFNFFTIHKPLQARRV